MAERLERVEDCTSVKNGRLYLLKEWKKAGGG